MTDNKTKFPCVLCEGISGLTQQELADKIGTKKSYISKLENGHADVQLSTLFRIFAGLGKRVSVAIL